MDNPKEDFIYTLVALAIVCLLIASAKGCYGKVFYHDWKCGFADCRILK